MKVRQTLGSAAVVWLLLAGPVQSTTCLILPFENQTRDAHLEWISESFAEGLAERLGGPSFYLVSREERAAAFDLLGIPAARILSRATILKVAETIDADYVVLGQYSLAAPNQLQAQARLLEMHPPRLRSKFTQSSLLSDLLVLQDRLAVAISRALEVGPGSLPGGLAPMPEPRVRLDAWENYIRGLLASSRSEQVKLFLQAARRNPRLGSAALELGKIYFQNRDCPTAIPWLTKLKREKAGFLEARFLLGICYFSLEEYEKAEAAFRTVAERLPLNEAYNNLGAAQSRRNLPAALDSFREAAEGDPVDPDYRFNLGYWHWKSGQYASAAWQFRLGLEGSPDDGQARALLVKSLERAGNDAEAARERELLVDYPAAVRFADLDEEAFQGLERLKLNYLGRRFRQLQLVLEILSEESLSRLPQEQHAEAHLERGRELFGEQRDAEALRELREAVRLNPNQPEAHLLLARLHERGGRREEAAREVRLALGWKNSLEAHLLLAKIYLEQEQMAEAEQQAQQALEVEPENAAAHSLLRTIQTRTP